MSTVAAPSTSSRALWLRDAATTVVLGAVMIGGIYGAARHHNEHVFRRPDAAAVVLLVAIVAALLLRRRYPVAVLGAVWALTLVYFAAGYPDGPIWLGLVVAYFTAVSRGHRLAGAVAAAGGFLAFPWLDDLTGRGPGPGLGSLSALAAWLLVVFGVGEWVRLRRLRAAEAARLREEEALRQASEERLRIARELHDVLAHNISLINVQAGVALHVNGVLPEQARTALAAIKDASREALGELRSALDVLRQSGDAPPRRPAPGLADLPDLVAGARTAGLDVRVETEGAPVAVPAPLDLAAYRVAQEALTNVIRHAAATTVWLRLTYAASELRLRIEDDGRGPAVGEPAGGGSGIAGMRERAAALGGELRTGRRPGGGFQVSARFALPASTESEP
ncbi:MAG TPA: sensor histidine kinase [Actinomycetota bacterium]|nr:sensor histidine kinase [Actinomycetota bacterium]